MAVFLSFDGELDTKPLIEQLWRAGKRVYLPVLHPFSRGNLLFLHYHPHSDLVTNRLKIRGAATRCARRFAVIKAGCIDYAARGV